MPFCKINGFVFFYFSVRPLERLRFFVRDWDHNPINAIVSARNQEQISEEWKNDNSALQKLIHSVFFIFIFLACISPIDHFHYMASPVMTFAGIDHLLGMYDPETVQIHK